MSNTTLEVVKHSLHWYESKGIIFENIIILQPTNPFRKVERIQEAIDLFIKKDLVSLVGITEAWQHPSEILVKKNNKFIKLYNDKEGRRQNFIQSFFISGALYIIKTKSLLETKKFLNSDTCYHILNSETALDIDNEFQFKLANAFVKEYGW